MVRRSLLGCLPVVVLAVCVWTACKDGDVAKPPPSTAELKPSTADLEKRCLQLGKVCGDQAKHVDKIVDACKQAAAKQVEHGCATKAVAVYDCYEQTLCTGGDKVWALEDLGVLADRHHACVAERKAISACAEN
jgi:hypothetical protein